MKNPTRRPPAPGFTLIEMIGALCILTILVTIVMQNVIENMKRRARDLEVQILDNLGSAFQASIVRTKTIPGATNWVAALSQELLLSPSRLVTNSASNPRLFLVDPDCRVGITNTLTLPYKQTNGGSIQPINARVLFVSSLTDPIPAVANTTANFSNLWNNPADTVPALWATNWRGTGRDLLFQQVNLAPMFNRVILADLDSTVEGRYSIDTTNTVDPIVTVPASTPMLEMWLLNGTTISLYSSDATSTNLTARDMIVGANCYTFDYGQWGRYARFGTNTTGWFGTMADQFLAASQPTRMATRRYPCQQWIADAMYQVLFNFGQWSLDRFTNNAPWPNAPGSDLSMAAVMGLTNYTKALCTY